MTLAYLLLFLCLTPAPLWGEQCKPHLLNHCKARCNNETNFDLSLIFDFPVTVSGDGFTFTWDPCKGIENCGNISAHPLGTKTAVCQAITDFCNVSCGRTSKPVWILENKGPPIASRQFPNWHIEYTFGDEFRMSIFYFVLDDTHEDPVVKMVSESWLTYYFHVIGKCIGQDTPECRKVYKKIKKKRLRNIQCSDEAFCHL